MLRQEHPLADIPDKAPPTPPKKDSIPASSQSAPPPPQPDTSAWFTREQSAKFLGVSAQTIKNYVSRGLLHPLRVPRRDALGREQQVLLHDPGELAHVRATLKGEEKRQVTTDTSTWLTRNQAVDSLSISIQTLKNYEKRGFLHPLNVSRRDTRGHEHVLVVYDPQELIKLPRGNGRPFSFRAPGEQNARANELFEQGKSIREVVVELRETSDKIREWYDKWLDDGGSEIVVSPESKKALEDLLGPFKDVTDLVDLVTEKLKPK